MEAGKERAAVNRFSPFRALTAAVCAITVFGCAGNPGAQQKKADSGYLIRDAHVITGTGRELADADILIRDGKIARITTARQDAQGAEVIDGRGKTLIPGLIDAHLHIQGFSYHDDRESDAYLRDRVPGLMRALLLKGVTTARDMGEVEHFIFRLRDEVRGGRIEGPNLLIVGPNITSKGGHADADIGSLNPYLRTGRGLACVVETEAGARATVDRLAAAGVDCIKICYHGGQSLGFPNDIVLKKFDKPIVAALVGEATKLGLRVACHTNNESEVREILELGVSEIEHGIADKVLEDPRIPELFTEKGIYFVPTLQIFSMGPGAAGFERFNKPNLSILNGAGVKIALGTDMMVESQAPDTIHAELAFYVDSGLSPMQAIMAGTRNAADCLGILARTGTVEEGKDADLILLDADPLANISNTRRINRVFKGGRLIAPPAAAAAPELPGTSFPQERLAYLDKSEAQVKGLAERSYELSAFAGAGTIAATCAPRGGESSVSEQVRAKPSLETEEWSYEKAAEGSSVRARREGDMVILTGSYKGKRIDKSFSLDGEPWFQLFPFDLASFAKSGMKEMAFKGIGVSDKGGAMSMATFVVKKAGIETIEIGGEKRSCVKLALGIPGFPIWHGYSWHDPETGILLRFGVKETRLDEMSIID
jgi:imidazolonepropionase-like amidohydrolase